MITKRLITLSVLSLFTCYSALVSTSTFAQTTTLQTLAGVRHNGPGKVLDSNATFAVGLSKDDGATWVGTAGATDAVLIRGEVRPEAAQVGQVADIFVVDRLLDSGEFKMRTKDGAWVTWNGTVSQLVPVLDDITLTSNYQVTMFSGVLGNPGNHRLFLGYLPPDGILRYHTSGLPVVVSNQAQTPRDQAYALFTSSISPNIIGSRCIACHVIGGTAQAGGAFHIFKTPLTSNLQANFDIFRGLVAARGVTHVMTKVTGGSGHGGGVQLTNGSADYQTLSNFVNLLAQDIGTTGGTGGTPMEPGGSPYDPSYPY